MGQTQGRVDGEAQAALMEVQRNYVNVRLEEVDFSNPTGVEEMDEEEEEEEAAAAGEGAKGGGDEAQTVEEEVRYHAYTPRVLKVAGMKRHPSDAVENGTLATVAPPAISYALRLAKERPEVVKEGKLSDLQLEFVTYACQKHAEFLDSGSRCGFFLGDGAGMGKGRQLAGLILENALQGRRKHVWVSTNIDLKEDAARDLGDVGVDDLEVFGLPASQKTSIRREAGVLFCTYSGLSKGCSEKSVEGGVGKRLDQVVDWLDDDFDGCLLFDEAHRAKNLISDIPGKETAAGRAVFLIQSLLPNARVVYCSATAVSEPRNYGYMTRLGLWGPRSPFPTVEEDGDENSMVAVKNFIKMASLRGVGAMEMCALHLKREGALLCRTLSYAGAAFDVVEATLTKDQVQVYDTAAQLWQILHTRAESKLAKMALAVEDNRMDAGDYKMSRQSYHSIMWGGHQRFFRSLITGFKVPSLVALANEALEEGKCVVIGLQSTGEAHAKRAQDKKADADRENGADDAAAPQNDMLSAPQETLRYVVEKIWEDELAQVRAKREADAAADAKAKASPSPTRRRAACHDDDGLSDSDDDDWRRTPAVSEKPALKERNRSSPPERKKQKTSEEGACWDFDDDDDDDDSVEIDLCGDDDGPRGGAAGVVDIEDEVLWIEAFLKKVDDLKLPGNALDVILEELGNFDAVAEMSGRSSRTVRSWTGAYEYQKRTANGVSMDEQNIYEREEFQSGRKLVAIISDAASSGISLHAERADRVANKRRRVHITLELPWSADKTIQQMGRSHRSNQVSAPEYKLLVSPLGGERRFCAAVVKRLESLGALTQGDRRATGVTKGWSCFNVDTPEGVSSILDIFHHANWSVDHFFGVRKANSQKPLVAPPKLPAAEREALAKVSTEHAEAVGAPIGWEHNHGGGPLADKIHLLHAAKLWLSLVGINVEEFEGDAKYEGVVAKFLNRILGLEVSRQQYLFDYFARYLEKSIQAAVRDGRYQRGIRTIAGRSVHFRGEPVTVDVQTPSSQPLLLHNVVADTGMDFDAALAKLEESRASAKSEAIVLDDDDDDDDSGGGKRSTGGSEWLGRLKVTNVSGGGARGFNGPADAERFGDRDGFRMLSPSGYKPGGICLIIETGEASMRGLSVKTDTFLVYRPHRVQELVKWGGQLRAGQPTPDALAKRAWDKEFNGRSRAQTNYLLTGPVLQIYPQIIQAQRANSAFNMNEVAIARAEEKDETGKKSGHVELGVRLDFRYCKEIIASLKTYVSDDEQDRGEALQLEYMLYQERIAELRKKH